MIDKIKIVVSDFSGSFSNCKKISRKLILDPDEIEYDNYRLKNKAKLAKQHLTIRHNKRTNKVTIIGSIRKYAYNKLSLRDLTKETFARTIQTLARELEIPFREFKQAKFTNCEIGANVNIRHDVKEVLKMIVAYSTLERKGNEIENGTLYFEGKDMKVSLYAKDLEIANKAHYSKRERKHYAFERMRIKGNNMLRIEFELFYQRTFQNQKMSHIKTVGDLIEYYNDLYFFWASQISRFIFMNKLDGSSANLKRLEYDIIADLEKKPFEVVLKDLQGFMSRNSKTKNSKKDARSRARRVVLNVLKNHNDRSEYHVYNFRTDIVKKFLLARSKSENLNFRHILQTLWGISPNLNLKGNQYSPV